MDESVIEIYNSTGIKVDEIIVRNKTVSIDTDHLPNELYLINVVANGRSVNNAKIIIKH
ncbi:MAG: T9SS type A sorting domain-containing protein [Bacteroidales bacterium]|nr:T9SS type A sorting domain-containing protein [Bacteroidales bacterium]